MAESPPSKLLKLPGALLGEGDLAEDLDQAAARLAFLSEASRVLASVLDYEASFSTLARLVVPYLADWCTVSIVQKDGQVDRVAVAHVDPEEEKLAKQLERRYRPDPNAPTGVPYVLRTGKSELVKNAEDWASRISSYTRIEAMHYIVGKLGARSYIGVPMIAHNEMLGVISLVTSRSGRYFDEEDLRLAEELASRAAMAVFHLRRYQETTRELERERIRQDVQRDLLSQQAHDIKSPLTAARLIAQLLARQLEGRDGMDQELRMIEMAIGNLDRIAAMVGGLREETAETNHPPGPLAEG